jgi:hypothetical protein
MPSFSYLQVQPKTGIQRDGTSVDCDQFIDGQWVRFYKNRPKKMGGYKTVINGNTEIVRNLITFNSQESILLYVGQPSTLSTINVYPDLSTSALSDRTPTGFVKNTNNYWSITAVSVVDITTKLETTYVVAVATQGAVDISNIAVSTIYYGLLYDAAPLIPLVTDTDITLQTSGVVLTLGNYLLILGNNGVFVWNDGLSITNFPEDNIKVIGTSKFVYAAPVRYNGVISGVAWTLDGVLSITYDGTNSFVPSYLSTTSTILSSGCVISYEPYFYWIGSNTFFMYNGAVVELQNNTNKLWFFANLNQAYKNRVVGFVNKKYNELCWLFPYGESTENNWMIVYNMTTQEWYDTPLERSAAASSTTIFPYPLLASSTPETFNLTTSYPIWAHEFGVNRVDPVRTSAILSYFTTNKLWLIDQNPQAQVLSIDTVILDVELKESMFFTINSQGYPNSTVQTSDIFNFDSTTQFLTTRVKGSILSLTFTSNVLDGDYLFGKTMLKVEITDDQRPGPTS